MATEKETTEVSDIQNDRRSIHENTERLSKCKQSSEELHFGKALAHRALYGAGSGSGHRRKLRINDVKAQPSRLSKVSLAEEEENN
ncbi:hypothetical protein CsatB_005945 [Cannabis sativa]